MNIKVTDRWHQYELFIVKTIFIVLTVNNIIILISRHNKNKVIDVKAFEWVTL